MTFPKTTFEKPIPISPTIALDRERCILCYRCTRFSENVARGRPARREEPRRDVDHHDVRGRAVHGAFTGNVTELCPVGALLPTQYRFEARPWEIQTVPTVCGMCPVGCNTWVDIREGKAKRVRSRNHLEIDEGWLCDKGRFAFTHLRAGDRIVDPIKRVRRRGFEPVSWDDALDTAEELLRAAHGRVVVALSGSETVEQAYALAKLVRHGTDSHDAVLPEEVSGALDAYRLPLSAIADAQVVAVLGDVPLAESAPIVDLWVRKARRNGARIVTSEDDVRRTPTRRPDLVRPRRPRRRCASPSSPSSSASPARTAAARSSCRRPRTAAASPTPGLRHRDAEPGDMESIGLLIVSGDEAASDPNVRGARRARRRGDRDLDVPRPRRRLGRPRPARHELPRARRHVRQHRRPAAAPAPAVDAARPGRARVDRAARRALRRRRSRRTRHRSSPRSPSAATAACRSARSASARRCAATSGAPAHVDEPALPEPHATGDGLHLVSLQAALLRPGRRARRASCSSSGRSAEVELSPSRRGAARHRDRRRGDADRRRHVGDPRARASARTARRRRARRARARRRACAERSDVAACQR